MKLFKQKLIAKIKKSLRSKRGESIVEAIVSFVILGMLLTTVFGIIRFSLVMSGDSISDANADQAHVNELVLEDDSRWSAAVTAEIVFRSVDPALDIEAVHDIQLYDQDGMLAFIPD